MNIMGKVVAICISEKRGTKKKNISEGILSKGHNCISTTNT